MIDEAVLRELVRDEFEAIDVPAHGARDIVARLGNDEVDQRRRRRQRGLIVAIAAAVLLVAWAIGPARDSLFGQENSFVASQQLEDADINLSATTSAGADTGVVGYSDNADADSRTISREYESVIPTSSPVDAWSVQPIGDQAKVVYTSSIDLEVERGAVGPTIRRVTAIATGVNGYVAKQQSDEGAGAPSATITIRVPSADFTRTVERIRQLGTVLSAGSSGVDVTAEYTDLAARSRSLEATRTQLFTVMQSAKTTAEILAVLDRITQIQTQLEQVQGRIKLLDDQTAFAAITATIRDKTPPVAPETADPKTGLAKAFDDAKGGFSRRVEWIVAHSGSAFVLIAAGLIALLILRLAWPRFRRNWL